MPRRSLSLEIALKSDERVGIVVLSDGGGSMSKGG